MKTAGGVDDENVNMPGQGSLAGIVSYAGWISPRCPFDDLASGPGRPDGKLISGGRAEGVASGQENRVPLIPQILRELGDRCRLPGAIDTGNQVDRRRL